tara:strand:- start:7462 stop:8241 length:780 start_codon:yes stop_codon:yes gene_type:complete
MYENFLKVIEINPTELCNLKCTFCPRSSFYPNRNLHVDLRTIKKFKERVEEIDYQGVVSFTGRGEPTLHPQFDKIVDILLKNRKYKLKINTNGKNIEKYLDQISQFEIVHLNFYEDDWDGYYKLVEKYKHFPNFNFYFKPPIPFELDLEDKYTNRAGSFVKQELDENFCDMIYEKLFIHWNGDFKICCQDWKTDYSFGNIFTQSFKEYLYENEQLRSFRNMLTEGRRDMKPCQSCDYRSTCNQEKKLKYTEFNESFSVR